MWLHIKTDQALKKWLWRNKILWYYFFHTIWFSEMQTCLVVKKKISAVFFLFLKRKYSSETTECCDFFLVSWCYMLKWLNHTKIDVTPMDNISEKHIFLEDSILNLYAKFGHKMYLVNIFVSIVEYLCSSLICRGVFFTGRKERCRRITGAGKWFWTSCLFPFYMVSQFEINSCL